MLIVEIFSTRARVAALKDCHSAHKTTTSIIEADEFVFAFNEGRRPRGHVVWEARWYDGN